jgi:hypothetical protein
MRKLEIAFLRPLSRVSILQLASFAGCIHIHGQNLARLLKVSPESPKSYRM